MKRKFTFLNKKVLLSLFAAVFLFWGSVNMCGQVTLVEWKFASNSTASTSPIAVTSYTNVTGNTTNQNAKLTTSSGGQSSGAGSSPYFFANATGAVGQYWQIEFSSLGYENINISSAQNANNANRLKCIIEYSINSAPFVEIVSEYTLTNSASAPNINNFPLPAATKQTNVRIRWRCTDLTNTATSRIGNISVTGTLAPQYTIDAESNNSLGTVNVSGNVITASRNDNCVGYDDPFWTLVSGSVSKVERAGDVFTVTASTNSKIIINFLQLSPYTVKLYNEGVQVGSLTQSDCGVAVTLPSTPVSACAGDNWDFAGWVEDSPQSAVSVEPSNLISAGSYTPERNINLYAVYKQVTTVTKTATLDFEGSGTFPYNDDWTVSTGASYGLFTTYSHSGSNSYQVSANSCDIAYKNKIEGKLKSVKFYAGRVTSTSTSSPLQIRTTPLFSTANPTTHDVYEWGSSPVGSFGEFVSDLSSLNLYGVYVRLVKTGSSTAQRYIDDITIEWEETGYLFNSNPTCVFCTAPVLDDVILDGNKTDESIELLAQLLSDGGCTTEYGFVYNTGVDPTIADGKAAGDALDEDGMYYGLISGLTANTAYWIRAYATNAAGTVYSDPIQVTTNPARCSVKPDAYDADPVGRNSFTAQWDGDAGDFILNVYTKLLAPKEEIENFDGFSHTNPTPPTLPKITTYTFQYDGWTMSAGNKNVYMSTSNPPSLTFSIDGDYVQTAYYEAPITTFGFWAFKQGSTSGAYSSITISGNDGSVWKNIEFEKSIFDYNLAGLHSYDLHALGFDDIYQIKVAFNKVPNGCNLAIDDIHVITEPILTKIPVTGYENLVVTGSSEEVTGLAPLSTYYYTVKAKGDDCVSVESDEIEVTTGGGTYYWLGYTDEWNEGENWSGKKVPNAGDHAIIDPAYIGVDPTYEGFDEFFPELLSTDKAVCDKITFAPGAELGNQHLMHSYNEAIVEYGLAPDNWYLISTPIEATVEDFHRGSSPWTWVQRFGQSYGAKVWNYITPLDYPFAIGDAFAFSYQNVPTTPFTVSGKLASNKVVNVPLKVADDGDGHFFSLVGNPFMTAIDFDLLWDNNGNEDLIDWTYLILMNSGYAGYNVAMGTYGVIDDSTLDEHIAPLQGFIVEKLTGTDGDDLVFDIDNIQATGKSGGLRSSKISNNKLSITASNSVASVRTIVAQCETGKPAHKLFDDLSKTPDIYTKNGTTSYGIQLLQTDDALIPLGLRTKYAGDMSFTFTGMDSYNAIITFSDVLTGTNIDLTDKDSYTYELNYTPVSNNEEGRFFIHFAPKTPTNIVTVSDGLVGQRYYNLQGVEIACPVEQGIYLVKNLFESGRTSVVKIIK